MVSRRRGLEVWRAGLPSILQNFAPQKKKEGDARAIRLPASPFVGFKSWLLVVGYLFLIPWLPCLTLLRKLFMLVLQVVEIGHVSLTVEGDLVFDVIEVQDLLCPGSPGEVVAYRQ